MATRLTEQMPRQAKSIFYSPSFQASLYAHRNILLGYRKHHVITIDMNKADRYRGDFIGYSYKKVSPSIFIQSSAS